MQQLEQPPPNAPAPPPGPEALRSQRIMRILFWIGVICLLPFAFVFIVALIANPKVDRSHALKNLRQIGLSLFEFDADYGRFPDASTIAEVKKRTSTPLTLDDSSSNKLFRQLIAHGIKSEKPFWATTPATPNQPDGLFATDTQALAPGECSFAYVAGLTSSDARETPFVMTSLEKGKTTFDRSAFKGKALVLFLDNSMKVLPIDKDGHVRIGGMDLFDPRQPFWKGKAPDIKWPE